jgi:type IV pilus assembly protein PilB
VERATAEQIKEVAIAEGMKTLREDGLEKVRLGITSLEEILRVVV